jgi:hypothetical protein
MDLAVGVADSQGALADEAPKQIGQQQHSGSPPWSPPQSL